MTVKSLQVQVGGNHYRKYKIQPLTFAEDLGLSPIMFCVFKYVCRFKDKNGKEDLLKALHCCDVYVECGFEKSIKYRPNDVLEFLEQFDDPLQRQALLFIFKAQCNKAHIKTVKNYINDIISGME